MYRIEQISMSYRRSDTTIKALQSVSLTIEDGEFLAIVGPSGSGKSTLLSILGAMLTPSAGKLWLDGTSIYELSPVERARLRLLRMGFVFQTFNLVPYLTALENVEVPLLLSGETKTRQRGRAMELLEQVGLSDRANHKPAELSIGQQQRVALARTLANDPAVVLADEPTGNLDPETRNSILAFLDQLHGQRKTIVLVTHDPHVAGRADRVLRMASGEVHVEPDPIRLSA